MGKFDRVVSDGSRRPSFLGVVGPWPLRPGPLTAFLAIFMMVWVGSYIANVGLPITADGWLRLALAIPSAVLIGLVLVGMQRLLGARLYELKWYLAALAIAAIVGAGFRVSTGQITTEVFPNWASAVAFSAIRLFGFMLVAQAVMGLTTQRLEKQISVANTALEESRRLQQRLIEADERLRAQVATLLHDRVQAGLIAACLELTDAIRMDAQTDPRVAVRDVTARLEAMRDIDVRQAVHRLSPDLTSLDLRTALEDLATQYLPGMNSTVEMGPDFTRSVERIHLPALLAAYRVCEQSLLNAAIHGRARNCHIIVDLEEGSLVLTVVDDGQGPSADVTPGLGTFINDTWAAILGGSWELRTGSTGGAVVTARFPLTGPDHADVDRALTGLMR